MSSFGKASSEFRSIDDMAASDQRMNRIHPLVKFTVTVFYIAVTVSFEKYNLTGLLGMAVYLICLYGTGDLMLSEALQRLRVILPLVCLLGLFNPIFDRAILLTAGGVGISGGVISMLTLMLKGIFSVMATYALIATTGIEKLCYALRLLHVPKILVTQILLIYRYIAVLIEEANRMVQAYSLRAPGQKGVHYRVWGSLAGQLLLRSMDRAQDIYENMCLRGYKGEFYYAGHIRAKGGDYVYLAGWIVVIALFRAVPVFEIVGGLFV